MGRERFAPFIQIIFGAAILDDFVFRPYALLYEQRAVLSPVYVNTREAVRFYGLSTLNFMRRCVSKFLAPSSNLFLFSIAMTSNCK